MTQAGSLGARATAPWGALARTLVVVAFVGVGLVRADSLTSILMYTSIWAISAIGLGLLLGLADQPALCQGSFMLVGGYVYGCTARTAGPDLTPLLALLAAVVAGAVLALLIAPVLRVRGYAFALVTIAVDLLVRRVLTTGDWLPGGQIGLLDIPDLSIAGIELSSATHYLWFTALLMTVLVVALHRWLGRGRTRRTVALVAHDEGLLAAFGRDAFAQKRALLVLAAALGALAGGIYAAAFGFLQPSTFTLVDSFVVAVAVSIGGKGRLLGAVLGALIFQLSYALVGTDAAELRPILLGATVIATMHFFPNGLLPSIQELSSVVQLVRRGRDDVARAPSRTPTAAVDDGAARPGPAEVEVTGISIEVVDAVQSFGSLRALDGLSLSIRGGSLVALVGPNGAGKSTLLRAIAGEPLTSGAVLLDGEDVGREPEHRRARRGVARTFQHVRLVPGATALENVLAGVDLHALAGGGPIDEPTRERLAAEALADVGLSHAADRRAEELSLAEERLVEMARVIATRPRLVLLDEPTAGLDHEECARMAQLIRRVHSRGCTLVLVEHDLPFAQSVATEVVALAGGRLLAHAGPEEVFADPDFAEAYLGSPLRGNRTGSAPLGASAEP